LRMLGLLVGTTDCKLCNITKATRRIEYANEQNYNRDMGR